MFWFKKKKKKTKEIWRLWIFYRKGSGNLFDNFQSNTAEISDSFNELEKWYLNSKKRYHKFVYDKGHLLLDREHITGVRIFKNVVEE